MGAGLIFNLGASAQEACKVFRTFTEGKPDLIPTGLPGVDRIIGGMFPGAAAILGADTGVGKSSVVLGGAMQASKTVRTGILSLEDGHDVLGSRAISLVSGVDSLKIRMKDLTRNDTAAILRAIEVLADIKVSVAYRVGAQLEAALEGINELAEAGCKMIYVDYLQKIRGSGQDRRNEVAGGFTRMQARAAEKDCAIMFVSQVARRPDMSVPPRRWNLKESGDLENEARLIVMLHRVGPIVHGLIDKSTVGGEDRTFKMERDGYGLREVRDDQEDF